MNQKMKFREDGTFTIIQFTDVHWMDGLETDIRSKEVMETVLNTEDADLVVFTGDLIYPTKDCTTDPATLMKQAVESVASRGIPWAYIFGNHDTEHHITRSELIEAVMAEAHSMTQRGPEEIAGEGNYVIEIGGQSGDAEAALYFMDSGSYSCLPGVKGYDWIRRNQIDWYVEQSNALADRSGRRVPSLAFFHIPLPEYDEVWSKGQCFGHKLENVCCPKVNTGLFAAMVEQGDVMGTFCGHDHLNDYWGEWHGIRLCYGRATGLNTYGREEFPHGARVIRLQEGTPGFQSWIRLENGEKIEQTAAGLE
ncbi:metallophosphoesterase family protein [Paenibacillus sp. J5C_2022]|uniref:metallophosphoesterase family protein n=1 Tax=Paenibacillus sp. J5C2022 TaxID=2977129 RepID=UPI0021D3A725|nr:metallophosphoesterase family protein [Paenibacillus sp. J5C2022]MCU6707772.1 metallophosphoesterase family protein [Paenibacillus sp. J5C2022]